MATAASTEQRVNSRPGTCTECGAEVPAGQGALWWEPGPDDGGDVVGRTPAGWRVTHLDSEACRRVRAERLAVSDARARDRVPQPGDYIPSGACFLRPFVGDAELPCADPAEAVRRAFAGEGLPYVRRTPRWTDTVDLRVPVEVAPSGDLLLPTPRGLARMRGSRGGGLELLSLCGSFCVIGDRLEFQVSSLEYGGGRSESGHCAIHRLDDASPGAPEGRPLFVSDAARAQWDADHVALAAAQAEVLPTAVASGYYWHARVDGCQEIADGWARGTVAGVPVLTHAFGNARILHAPRAIVERAWQAYAEGEAHTGARAITADAARSWLAEFGPEAPRVAATRAATARGESVAGYAAEQPCAGWELYAWAAGRVDLLEREGVLSSEKTGAGK